YLDINWSRASEFSDKGKLNEAHQEFILNNVLLRNKSNIRFDRRTGVTQLEIEVKGHSSVIADVSKNDKNVDVFFRDIAGYNWKLSPDIFIKNPSDELPFTQLEKDGDESKVIPLQNTQKNTGEESNGLLMIKKSGNMHLFTKSQDGSWNTKPVHSGNSNEQVIDGYLLLALNEIGKGKNEVNDNHLYTYIQKALDYYTINNPGSEYKKFQNFVDGRLNELVNDSGIKEKNTESSFTLQKIIKNKSTEGFLSKLRNHKAVSIKHIDNTKVFTAKESVETRSDVPAATFVATALRERVHVFPLTNSYDSQDLSTVSAKLMGAVCQGFYEQSVARVLVEETDIKPAAIDNDNRMKHQKYQTEAIRPVDAFEVLLIPTQYDKKNRFKPQLQKFNDYKERFTSLAQQVKFKAEETESALIKELEKSDLNTDNVQIARNLWVNNQYPTSCDPSTQEGSKNKLIYDQLMSKISQLNLMSNRLHFFSQRFETLKNNLIQLRDIQDNLPQEIYTTYAEQSNADVAEMTGNIIRFEQDLTTSSQLTIDQRKMDLFAESRGIQWREHQEAKIPVVMNELSEAIKKNEEKKIVAKWGAGSGKSLFMTLLSDAALEAIPPQEKRQRNVI
ncbi:MAG: hypothetical protein ACPGEF_05060, partial [Endozoicomonas sp.]